MTEQEKMLAGKIYDSSDETLLAIRTKAHKLCQTYNQTASSFASFLWVNLLR